MALKPAASATVPGGSAEAEIESVSCASPGNCSAGGDYIDSVGNRQVFVADEINGTWDTTQEIPGTASLNTGGSDGVYSASCGSAGNCSIGGYYSDSSGKLQAFVATETNGAWGAAEEAGTAALNVGGSAEVTSVSCASAGNCSAGGTYASSSNQGQAFVVAETNGSWGTAQEVPGTAVLNAGGAAEVNSVSCVSAGNCSAGGYYSDSSGDEQAFAATQTDGTWGAAEEVPGTAALNTGGFAQVTSVSCVSAGNCGAGGFYLEVGTDDQQAFVASETNGTWGNAEEVPGTASLNSLGYAQVNSVSCASAGNCSAGGFYADNPGGQSPFVVTETDGSWGTAQEVPGAAAVNVSVAEVLSVSCASAGNCIAAGYYTGATGEEVISQQAFVADETNGTWGTLGKVSGTAALNAGGAQATSVSCASVGNCSVGGSFTDDDGNQQAFVAGETNGAWGRAGEVPGSAALNGGVLAQVTWVSCASAGNCLAGGQDVDSSSTSQAFVAAEASGTWGTGQDIPGLAALNTGGRAQVNAVSCPSAGNCSAGGFFVDNVGNQHGFVAAEKNGSWGTARESPGANLNADGYAQVTSIACASAGNCSAGGQYADKSGDGQAFVANETNGVWRTGKKVTGAAGFNAGDHAVVTSVSCASAGNCGAAGSYLDASGFQQVFVVNETNGVWGSAQEIPGTAALNTGGFAQVTSVSCASAGNCSAGGYYRGSNATQRAFVVGETNGAWGTAAQVSGTGTGQAQVNAVSCGSAGNCTAGGSYLLSGEPVAFVVAETNGTWGSKMQVPGSKAFKQGAAAVETIWCASAGNCSAGGYYTQFTNTYTTQAFVVTETNGTWNSAIKVPGTGVLNAAGYAVVTSVSCTAAGDCSAGGYYFDSSQYREAFVVNQANGTWASAEQVPGTAVPGAPPR
jgi:hypothetical protein